MFIFLLPLAVVIMLAMPLVPVVRGKLTGKKAKHAIVFNICAFFGVLLLGTILPLGGFASAAAETTKAVSAAGMAYIAAAVSTGLGSIGCGIAVAAAAPAAIGATAEEPKSFVKSLIFVALGEGVAIYGLLIAILILGRV